MGCCYCFTSLLICHLELRTLWPEQSQVSYSKRQGIRNALCQAVHKHGYGFLPSILLWSSLGVLPQPPSLMYFTSVNFALAHVFGSRPRSTLITFLALFWFWQKQDAPFDRIGNFNSKSPSNLPSYVTRDIVHTFYEFLKCKQRCFISVKMPRIYNSTWYLVGI